jgi:hypothetical protein
MNLVLRILLAALATAELCAQRLQPAKPSDIATGVIVLEDRQQLRLDASPCARTQDKVIIVFRPPYTKVPVPKITCNGTPYARVEVIQRQSRK